MASALEQYVNNVCALSSSGMCISCSAELTSKKKKFCYFLCANEVKTLLLGIKQIALALMRTELAMFPFQVAFVNSPIISTGRLNYSPKMEIFWTMHWKC